MDDKPLIALLTNNDDDIYCFRLELIQAILKEGYRLLISCPDGPKFEVMESIGLCKDKDYLYDDPPIDRRGTSLINDTKLIMHYRSLFKKYRPHVILSYTAKPNVYASLVASGYHIPVINNVTGLGSIIHAKGIKKFIIMSLFKTAYRKSSCIMFQNSTNMKLANDLGWIKGDYKLIPGSGVALDRFPIQDYPDGGNGIEGEPIVFNYIGRVMHDKGIDDYIEAAKRIKDKYSNTEFNILGFIEPTENHYEAELKLFEEQGILFYRGSQKDVKPWIRRAHAIVHPSTYGEGMSNVLLENASSGRLIITTDNPGCRETVDENISGYIYRGGDVEKLVEKIEIVINGMSNDDRKKMGLNGRRKVENEFSRDIVIDAYIRKIKELI
ncbi:MAG: glycosyltransferase family 4 protein [Clostridia bacterium]|nr:glycosyltransferase family 4 protein [Clostridia bacterium]